MNLSESWPRLAKWVDCSRPEPAKETTEERIARVQDRRTCRLTKAWCVGVFSVAAIGWPAKDLVTSVAENFSYTFRGATQAEMWDKQNQDLGLPKNKPIKQQAQPLPTYAVSDNPLIAVAKGFSLLFGIGFGAYAGSLAYDARKDKKTLKAEENRLDWERSYYGRQP